LGGGSHEQGVQAAPEPAKIKPSEDGADRQAKAPEAVAKESDQQGGEEADEEGQPGDAALGESGGSGFECGY